MAGATYICVLGCMAECPHREHVPCVVMFFDQAKRHPEKHIGDDGTMLHEWKEGGRCKKVPYPIDD